MKRVDTEHYLHIHTDTHAQRNSITLGIGGVKFGRFIVISIVRRSSSPRKF